MKKVIFVSSLFALIAMLGVSHTTFAAACDIDNLCPTNGPTIPNPVGWRHLDPGQEDCPAWFTFAGCVTPRIFGQNN